VLGCAVTLSLAAQVVEAEFTAIGWIAAAVPARREGLRFVA
jgi:hypothetical protein